MKPFVSICTPTFNRRPFIPYLKQSILNQDYPQDRLEWIVVDDGIDKIEDLVSDVPFVKYLSYKEVLSLGKKRNIMNNESKGDFIIYFDDDDFYPSDRISHAVETLIKNPKYLIAGSSEMHCFFPDINKLYQFGPYGPLHATAATFCFRRELLKQTSFSEAAMLAEEKHFLKEYTIPLIQLDTTKTILVLSHIHNTFDKKKLIKMPNSIVKESRFELSDFIKKKSLKKFYTKELNNELEKYELGKITFKPEVLKQINELSEKRTEHLEKFYQGNLFQLNQKLEMMEKLNKEKTLKIELLEKNLNDKDRLIQELFKKVKVL